MKRRVKEETLEKLLKVTDGYQGTDARISVKIDLLRAVVEDLAEAHEEIFRISICKTVDDIVVQEDSWVEEAFETLHSCDVIESADFDSADDLEDEELEDDEEDPLPDKKIVIEVEELLPGPREAAPGYQPPKLRLPSERLRKFKYWTKRAM